MMAAVCKAEAAAVVPEQFPVGLRVLVVDDDLLCLRIIEQMLRKCKYNGLFLFLYYLLIFIASHLINVSFP